MIPALLAGIGLYALYRGVDVFSTFLEGAKKGLATAVGILPTLVGLLTAVYMLRASGCIDLAGKFLSPYMSILGIPEECTALGAAQASQWWGRTRARQRDYPDMRRRQLFGASGCRNARRIGDESVHHQFVLRAPGDEEYTLCCSRGTGGGRGRLCRISIFVRVFF